MRAILIRIILSLSVTLVSFDASGMPKAVSVIPVLSSGEELKETSLYAKSAVLLDGDSGRVLYEKNGYEPMPMASTTKIMTCIVVLENTKPDDVVTVSKYAASMPDVQLNIREGEKYYVGDLLYSLMLESHNDTSVALAEQVGGSVKGFAKRMNQKAKELGCENTYFITPNGLDAEDETGTHSTSAADLARIMKYCIKESPKKEEFLKITQSSSHSFSDLDKKRSFSCNNHNAFLHMMDGAISGKTGFTGKAGYCYVGALKRDNKTLIVALLACGWPNNKTYKWSDTKQLMNYGLKNYSYHRFQEAKLDDSIFNAILVEDGQTKQMGQKAYVDVLLEKEKELPEGVLLKAGETITINYEKKEQLKAPVDKGTPVGTITYCIGKEVWNTQILKTKEEVKAIDFSWCIEQILHLFLL